MDAQALGELNCGSATSAGVRTLKVLTNILDRVVVEDLDIVSPNLYIGENDMVADIEEGTRLAK